MKKTLAIATLALGLFAFGCDDDEDGGKPDASTKTDASADATPDTGGTGGTGGKVDTSTADAVDGGSHADTHADVAAEETGGGDAGSDATSDGGNGPVSWTTCVNPKDDVPPGAFCLQYMTACGFDATATTVGMERYGTLSDCVMKYEALNATQKGCAAYHLCVASQTGMAATHCPHPPEASLATPAGPCK